MKDEQKKDYIAPQMSVYVIDCKTVLLQSSVDAPPGKGSFD